MKSERDKKDEYSTTLKNFIKGNNLENNVFLYGSCSDTHHILKQANVGILVSTFEGFQVTLLEYGMANLAVSLAKICTIVPHEQFLNSFKKKELELKNLIIKQAEGILPQGAPSSPKLSNLISISIDNRLSKLAQKNELAYSRYADDITFSGNVEVLKKVKSTIYRIIKEENLFVNYSKTTIKLIFVYTLVPLYIIKQILIISVLH